MVFRRAVRREGSLIIVRRRMRRKAVMRVASVLEGSDQMVMIVLMRFLRTFLKERR